MVWAIDNDDFVPECSKVRYPLLKTISAAFKQATDGDTKPDGVPSTTPKPKGKASSMNGNAFTIICLLTSVFVAFQFS